MATTMNTQLQWADEKTHQAKNNIWNKWIAFADSQSRHRTFWFLFSLVFQGVFFLPLPAALTFYYGAPVFILAITLVLFFANVIAGMGGSGIRVMLSLFALSILVHIIMTAIYLL